LEQAGKLADAADRFDQVCRTWPKSKYCTLANERSGDVLLRLAKDQIRSLEFELAEANLRRVRDSKGPDWSTKASAILQSPEMVMGLRWRKLTTQLEKAKAQSPFDQLRTKKPLVEDIAEIAASKTPASMPAEEWLNKERPSILLYDAGFACGSSPVIDSGTGKIYAVPLSSDLTSNETKARDCAKACRFVIESYRGTGEAGIALKGLMSAAETVCAPTMVALVRSGPVEVPKPCSPTSSKNCAVFVTSVEEVAAGSAEAKKAKDYLRADERRCGKPISQ